MSVISIGTYYRKDSNSLMTIILIACLIFGALGGAVQVIRLLSILLIPINILYILIHKIDKLLFFFFIIGIIWCIYGYWSLSWCYDVSIGKFEVLYIILNFNYAFSIVRIAKNSSNPTLNIIYGWCGFVIISIPIAIFEIITNIHLPTNEIQMSIGEIGGVLNGIENKRYAAVTFNNYNEYMTCLSFSIPYIFSLLLYHKNRVKQYCDWILILLISLIILITASRGASLVVVTSFIVFLFYYRKIKFKGKKQLIRIIIGIFIISIILGSNIIFQDLKARLESSGIGDTGRMDLYQSAINYFIPSLFSGIGPGSLKSQYMMAPHNLFVEIVVQYGIIIFIMLLLYCVVIMYKGYKIPSKLLIQKYIYWCSFLVLPIISIINSDYLKYGFFWVAFASIIVIVSDNRQIS